MATNTPAADGYSPPRGGQDTGLFKIERSRSLLSLGTTEANVVVPVAGVVVVAVRRPRVLRGVVPAAATQHPVVALRPMTSDDSVTSRDKNPAEAAASTVPSAMPKHRHAA